MSFYQTSTGGKLTGSEEASHVNSNTIIPDGTKTFAMISKAEEINGEYGHYYQVIWKLMDGEYKGCEVRQKMDCYSKNEKRADRAKNMLVRLFNLTQCRPVHSNPPKTEDLMIMNGKILGIKINEWQIEDKNGNFVSEVHLADDKFEKQEGKKMDYVVKPVQRKLNDVNLVDDDLPF